MTAKGPKRKKLTKLHRAAANLSPQDRARLTSDVRDRADLMQPQIANWLSDAVRVTEMVAKGNTDIIPVFWIRMYGILADITDEITRQLDFATSMNVPRRKVSLLKGAIDVLAKTFTEDELIYLQYRRHVECHPLQDSYRLKLTGGGLQDSVFLRLPGKKTTVVFTTETIRSVLQRYGVAEHLIALDFAKRSLVPLSNVQKISISWFGPPQ